MTSSNLQNFKKYALRAHDAFDSYFEILQPLIAEKFPDDTKVLATRLRTLRERVEGISIDDATVQGIADLCDIGDEISDLFSSFDAPRMQSMNISNSNVSGTNRLDIVDAFEDLTGKYTQINKSVFVSLNEIAAACAQKIANDIKTGDAEKKLTQLHEVVLQHISAYDMYLQVLQLLISENILVHVIEQLLESDKNAVLVAHIDASRQKSNLIPHRRLGLIPHDNILRCTPRELHAAIYGSAKDITFSRWAKDRNITILIINSVAYDVVEYKTSQLFKKDTSLVPAYGISRGIIERTTIISADTSSAGFDFSVEVHNEDAKVGFVFETIDGKHYRMLHRRDGAVNAANAVGIEPFDIADIVKYYKAPSMHTRVSTYQDVCNKEACRKMMVRKQPNTNLFEITSKTIDTNYIKNQVVLRLNGVLHTQLSRAHLEHNMEKDIMKILHSPQLVDEFAAALLDFYKIGAVNTIHDFSGGQFSFAEMLSSFLVEVENLRRQFIKELHDGYSRTQAFKDGVALSSYEVQRRLETLIIDVVQTVIPSDDNIYSSLNYKYMLLNYNT